VLIVGSKYALATLSPDPIIYEKPAVQDESINIEALLKKYSEQYAVSYEEMKRVMMCESGGKVDVVGDGGNAYGLFQFWEGTFYYIASRTGEDLDWKNPEHQIKVACYGFAHGFQPHWTCWKPIK